MTRLTRFSNNAVSKLAANLSNVGLTVTLTPGEGAKFPPLSGGQVFFGTLAKVDGTKEIVKVTARSTDTLTIVRAVEAVAGIQTAFAFSAGDAFELRMTAGSLGDELDRLDAAAFMNVLNKTANYTIVEADVCSLVKTDTTAGNITITLPQISTLVGSFEIQVQKNTADANTVTVARAGADTINGLTSYSLSAQYQCVWLVADLATNTWTAITSAAASNRVADSFVGAGTAGPFTLSGDPGTKNNTDVYVGGVYQKKSTYTLSGTQLTLGGSVTSGVFIECLWSQPVSIGTPADGTVTPAKLSADSIAEVQNLVLSVSGTNTITGTVAGITTYKAGQTFKFVAAGANTGAATININGLGAVSITKSGSTALDAGDISAGGTIQVIHDGTQFQLTSGAGGGGGGATGGGKDKAFYEGDTFITTSFTVGQSAQNSCTISIASPAVITQGNTYVAGQQVRFTTTGALPTGLSSNAVYYVSATGLTTSSFQVSATSGGASVNTSGTQSGVQTCGKLKHATMLTPAYFATGVVVSVPTGSRLVGL
jgi:hypothetical protein